MYDFFQALTTERVEPKSREKQVRAVVVETLKALLSLHEEGLVHRDVKLENLVFREKGKHSPRYTSSPRSASPQAWSRSPSPEHDERGRRRRRSPPPSAAQVECMSPRQVKLIDFDFVSAFEPSEAREGAKDIY